MTQAIVVAVVGLLLTTTVAVVGWLVKAMLDVKVRLITLETDAVNFHAEINRRWEERVTEVDSRCDRRMAWLQETAEAARRSDRNIIRLAATLAPNLELETG